MKFYEPMLLCDFYKLCHAAAFPEGTEVVYSPFSHRNNKYLPMATGSVVFEVQGVISEYLIDYFQKHFFSRPKKEVVDAYVYYVEHSLESPNTSTTLIEKLHDLGHLPLRISALPEGTIAPAQVPIFVVENTHKDFYWLPNYVETLLSCELWHPMTVASIAHAFRKVLDKYALDTVGHTNDVDFQAHDFSMRGHTSFYSAAKGGAGHLLSFKSTDTIAAIMYLVNYYNANLEKEIVGMSVNATEHSVMCANTPADSDRDEYNTFKRLITEVFKTGIVSLVSDSYDFWKVVDETIPALKEIIMARKGKVVIRPDSGNPKEVLCGHKFVDMSSKTDTEIVAHYMEKTLVDYTDAENIPSQVSYKYKYLDSYKKITLSASKNESSELTIRLGEIEPYTRTSEEKGLVESLWDIFGGTVSEKGYKVLDEHIGAIYGDSITYDLTRDICEDLKEKGFASTNVVLGIGSFTYQGVTRDSLSFAMKATSIIINGEEHLLYKDPKTDPNKRSQRGRIYVYRNEEGIYEAEDGHTRETLAAKEKEHPNALEVVFEDGKLIKNDTLSAIRERLKKEKL